jgi:LDH2 family malate/lactate/ureidoglycolate dehydrogenase
MVIQHQELELFAERILRAVKVDEDKARLIARSLVASNLRAVDSHGIQLLPFYIRQIENANINIAGQGHVASESGGCALYDGENSLGAVVASHCCEHAVRLGKAHGIAIVVARDSNHFGAAAYWARKISADGLIGLVMCNASPLVPPWQGREPRVGTNPICVSVPGPKTWLLDMATTTVAAGKIFKAHLSKQPSIPHGWAMDSEGVPTTDTEVAMQGLLMPLGGYKGSGLAMMAEIFCAVLAGSAMSTQLGGIRVLDKPARVSQCFLAVDVTRFMPLDQFANRMQELVGMIKSSTTAKGYDEVLVAGEPEWRAEPERRVSGIPISTGTWKELADIADRYNVPIPDDFSHTSS